MDQKKLSQQELQTAFAVTSLEPEIPESTLNAYAANRATDVERELVETMLGVDPSLAETIEAIREELASVNEPLLAGPATVSHVKKAPWMSRWFSTASTMVAVGACLLLMFEFSDRSHLIQDAKSKDKQVAIAIEANQVKLQLLQQKFDAEVRQFGAATSDKRHLAEKLAQTQKELDKLIAAQAGPALSPDGLGPLVARAMTQGLSMPPPPTEEEVSRGTPEISVTMAPDRTSVRLPVRLSWSGPVQGDYHVEITKNGEQIWNAHITESAATPPAGLLKPGVSYQWRIAESGKRGPWAAFRTSSAKEASRANHISKDRNLGPLEKGVGYAALGLVPEAEAQFKILKSSDPSLAAKLLKELKRL